LEHSHKLTHTQPQQQQLLAALNMFRTSRATVVGLVACLSAAETVQAGFSMEDVLRVLGGSDASTTDYPWMASVEVVSGTPNGDVSFFCGGTFWCFCCCLRKSHPLGQLPGRA